MEPVPPDRRGPVRAALLIAATTYVLAVATIAFAGAPGPYFARLVSAPGLLGLAAPLGVVAIPWIQVRRHRVGHPSSRRPRA